MSLTDSNMATDTVGHIQASAAQNNQLLHKLAQAEYAPSALQQQQVYIKDLRSQLAQVDVFLKNQQTKLNHERHDYEKYKESTVHHFTHKVVGKREDFEA
jgi:small-conductance mechanosensitive channel